MYRRGLAAAGAYLLLLAASHVFTPFAKSDAPAPDLRYAELHVVDHGVTGPGVIRLAYRVAVGVANAPAGPRFEGKDRKPGESGAGR